MVAKQAAVAKNGVAFGGVPGAGGEKEVEAERVCRKRK
jgi:hypothetical protein